MTTPPDVPPFTPTPVERALAIVRASNRTLIRIADEQALLDEICRIAVELGGYRLALVGFAEDGSAKNVCPVAFAGHDAGYLSTIKVSWVDEAHGRGPAGTAIRTGQPVHELVAAVDGEHEEPGRRGRRTSRPDPGSRSGGRDHPRREGSCTNAALQVVDQRTRRDCDVDR